jgi:hypothetical protein
MTQEEFISLHADILHKKLRKWDRCGLRFWEYFTDAERYEITKNRGCNSCAFNEEGYCHNAGKEISKIDMY